MGVETLLSVDDYLNTSYSPDREYRDGVLLERNVGDKAHSLLQGLLVSYLNRRRKQWNIRVYPELRVRMREDWYPIPDVCIYVLPGFETRYPTTPPLLWIEILSQDDRMIDVWNKANELVALGVPYVWIIDPNTLESEVRTAGGVEQLADKTLRIPDTDIVIPLADVMEE
ncbi:MAG TPA: Uma2 family endonuclease [Candidatus Acidoferrales bacterium]|nr:Uma2 family endonuclease [Candidatus Acidoferrales bacterium]HXK03079.1 Uma2 family endonuclease [Verrucomicrobiae bacterium]